MEGLPESSMIKLSVVLFKFVGESKISTTRALRCLRIFNVIALTTALWFAFVNFFFIEGEMYVQALQSSMFFAHPLLKYLSFLRYKSNIKDLLNEVVNKFWDHQHYSRNVAQETERIHRTVERLQTVMLMIGGLSTFAYMLKPFLAANRGLPLESFIPGSNIMDAILLFTHFYCFSIGVPFVLGYDFIYFALCTHIVLQFKLLKYKIRNVLSKPYEDTTSQIDVCIQHHQFLFTMLWKMQTVYSMTLLFHYIGTVITTCALLLEVLLRHTNFMNYIAKLFTIFVFMGQFALYAFPAEQVTSEFAGLSDAIYTSFWYKKTVSNQKMLLYVMTVAQRVHYLSGAGLININIDTFESVFRKSFSFCAVFKNLIEK